MDPVFWQNIPKLTAGLTWPPENGALMMIPANKLIATNVSPSYDLLELDTPNESMSVAMA